ncbi:MAG TPA: DHA2 family efflux MFS transporter permease subunit [Tepidisphaeraceae bacterium]|nr:DHA2 family efflux MFS transporter permease subunit [Tepidisphaeraceae bacterium]
MPSSNDQRHVNPWLIAVIVSMATFMEVLDTSIANVSLRYIAGSLAAGIDESTWVLTSYLVSNAIILPVSGWLATRIGRKRFYMLCVALFTVSSLLCGLAPSLSFLIVCRVLQGAGGGGLAPSEQAILTDTFPPAQRGQAFALYGVAVVVAPAVGPSLGGWITDTYSWRWIFFINVPIGILSLLLIYFVVPGIEPSQQTDARAGKRIDYLGFGLVALGLGCLQVVLDRGQIDDWFASTRITIFVIVSGTALILLVIHELTVDGPVVDLRLLGKPSFFIANLIMFLFGGILFGTTQLIPQLLQQLLGYTATLAGLVLSPGALLVICLLPLVGFLLGRGWQPKYLIMFGFLNTAAALWYMSGFDLQISFATAVWARCFQAAGLAFLFVPINTVAYSGLPPGKSNEASALINVMRNLGGSVGISVAQTMLARRSQFHQSRLVEYVAPMNLNYRAAIRGTAQRFTTDAPAGISRMARSIGSIYAELGRQALMMSYLDVFYVMSWAALCSVVAVWFLKKTKPGEHAQAH